MITEKLINNADENVKSFCTENKKLWYCIYILICVSIIFGIILLYFIFRKSKNNLDYKKDNISPSIVKLSY
jgi:preprotein translocase subunit Sec63